jgi:hypothetical protein
VFVAPRRLHAPPPHMSDHKLSGDAAGELNLGLDGDTAGESHCCTALTLHLALADQRAADLTAALDACKQSEAELKSKLAATAADLRVSRLEASRLRGAFSSSPPSPPSLARHHQEWLPTSSVQARVQAAVQATLRAERWHNTQRLACPVCLEREKDCALNCGHTYCGPCAWRLASCALCRGDITARTHLFFS